MTVSDPIYRGAETCQHPDTYRCRETCECLCGPCWDKRHVGVTAVPPRPIVRDLLALPALRDVLAAATRDAKRLASVRALHSPLDRGTGPQCQGCATHVTFTPWPCPTMRALDGP